MVLGKSCCAQVPWFDFAFALCNYANRRSWCMAISISSSEVGTVSIVVVRGRITFCDGVGTLRAYLDGLAHQGKKKIMLRLKDLEFIDAFGLKELIGIVALSRPGGELKILDASPQIHSVFEMAKMHELLEFFSKKPATVAGTPTPK